MRNHGTGPGTTSDLDRRRATRWRSASIRFPFWNRTRAVLALAGAILLLWLPIPREWPGSRPSRLVRGTTRTPIRGLAIAPDGNTIATVDDEGGVRLRRALDGPGSERALDEREGVKAASYKAVSFSPDGHFLAIGWDWPGVVLCRTDGAEPRRILGIPVRQTSHLSFSPDGRRLAVASYCSNEIRIWDLAASREWMTLRAHPTPVLFAMFSPDGRSLASAGNNENAIFLWDLGTGRASRRLTGLASPPLGLAFSPDGRRLASFDSDPAVRIWDVGTGREVRRIAGHRLSTRSLAFSPDGRLLATASGDGAASLWSVATGRELRRLDAQADILNAIAFSSDGRTLAAAANDGDVRLWDVDERIGDPTDRERALRPGRDGELLHP